MNRLGISLVLMLASDCKCSTPAREQPAEVLVRPVGSGPRIARPKGPVTEATVPRFREDAAIEKVGGRWVAATEDQLHAFEAADGAVSETGERIVELIDGHRTVGQIVDVLFAEFEVPREVALADALAFIELLAEREVLTWGPTSSRAQ